MMRHFYFCDATLDFSQVEPAAAHGGAHLRISGFSVQRNLLIHMGRTTVAGARKKFKTLRSLHSDAFMNREIALVVPEGAAKRPCEKKARC